MFSEQPRRKTVCDPVQRTVLSGCVTTIPEKVQEICVKNRPSKLDHSLVHEYRTAHCPLPGLLQSGDFIHGQFNLTATQDALAPSSMASQNLPKEK